MLRTIVLKFGESGGEPLQFDAGGVTVVVGPNNGGKSLLIREIATYIQEGEGRGMLILGSISPKAPDAAKLRAILERHLRPKRVGEDGPGGHSLFHAPPRPYRDNPFWAHPNFMSEVLSFAAQSHVDPQAAKHLLRILISHFTLLLDGQSRLGLANQQPLGDLQKRPENALWKLAVDDDARNRIRSRLHAAFSRYFVLDPTNIGQVRVRFSDSAPVDGIETGFSQATRDFMAKADEISALSDGVKAYTGITIALSAGEFSVVLIDEPEAFLHPPLARRLGLDLAQVAGNEGVSVVVATHSADFLMGCVEAGFPMNIVRLSYTNRTPRARLLSKEQLGRLFRDPLVRSTGLLGGLFHKGVVVCEGEVDRAFYQEINHRLLIEDSSGAEDTAFLSSAGKQNCHRLLSPLRQLGVRAAVIVDLDVFKRGTLSDLMAACEVPASSGHGLQVTIGDLRKSLEANDWNVERLPMEERESLSAVLLQLSRWGLFVVPNGEVEVWLPELGVEGKRSDWLSRMFEKLGDRESADYIKPAGNGVWDFIRGVADWIRLK